MNKTMVELLGILNKYPDKILGSRKLSKELKLRGIEITERTVRYHLRILDEKGFTRVFGKEGRMITRKGREEISHAFVSVLLYLPLLTQYLLVYSRNLAAGMRLLQPIFVSSRIVRH